MKINEFINESTTSGSVATVATPMTTQSRNASIYGGKKGGNLLTGKKTNKKYANSIHESEEKFKVQIICDDGGKTSYTVAAKDKEEALRKATKFANRDGYEDFEAKIITESKMKQVASDLETMQDGNFKQKYGKTKEQIMRILGTPSSLKPKSKLEVNEAHLEEDDVIIVPGQGLKRKTGFIPHGQSRVDHEVEMARSDLFSAAKNAKQVYELIADLTEEEGLEGWVQEKIIKANDYLNTIREYLEGKELQKHEMTGGVIAGGGAG